MKLYRKNLGRANRIDNYTTGNPESKGSDSFTALALNMGIRANLVPMAIVGCLISTTTLAVPPGTSPVPATPITSVEGGSGKATLPLQKSQVIGYVELTRMGGLGTGNQLFSNCLASQYFGAAPNRYGYYESVVKLSFDPNQGCPAKMCFVLDYDGAPTEWTLNIGDSLNNNGYGGGAASDSTSVAELQILGNEFAAYSTVVARAAVDKLTSENLQLSQGAFKVCVGNHYATWGNPGGTLDTTNSNIFFRLPDNAPSWDGSAPGNGNYELYAAFNRVIAGGRSGGGLARVIITNQ